MKKRTPFKHLQERHRDRIHALYSRGYNQKEVADVLGVLIQAPYLGNWDDTGE